LLAFLYGSTENVTSRVYQGKDRTASASEGAVRVHSLALPAVGIDLCQ
jgi:hypothetical protein